MSTWPDNTPKSTGNAFSIPKRVEAEPKRSHHGSKKRKERAVTTAWMTEPMPGLSAKAQKQLMVPTARVTVVLEGSNVARIPIIPKAQRSNTCA